MAKFITNEVTAFLENQYPYAAQCFAQDTANTGKWIGSLEVSNWFQKYFPSFTGYNEFRNLECSVTQYIEDSNL